MDRNDQQAIGHLFEKLANVERQAPPRDAEAERFIQDQITRQPGAPYYMAQTIVVQEQALNAAQARIEENATTRFAKARSFSPGARSRSCARAPVNAHARVRARLASSGSVFMIRNPSMPVAPSAVANV
ncbi:MAG: DUF2076 domain-containing protein [Mesorhizobium sp.]|uniref:DUF2076 domain-containing protein n=1 Tax=Mesorhizobium sp. TaxID=1871066 RepID=UPI00122AAB9D|nr:DUF2076 family protein [Mesorhizobium sp.]TIT23918.1 MAG: DUF2076 domain-containing protein [Mesorhizobium sp.]